MFSTLPVDVTFVDANDRVAFFSEGPDRVFARSKAIIGRKVQHCHPPKSVDTVNQILDDFRGGRQSVAEFWLEFHGRFVHVRYFAVRDAGEGLPGTLEVTQDATKIRALAGERRLLQYDSRAGSRLTPQKRLEPGGNGRLEANGSHSRTWRRGGTGGAGRRYRRPRRRGESPAHASGSPELADKRARSLSVERRGRPPRPEGNPVVGDFRARKPDKQSITLYPRHAALGRNRNLSPAGSERTVSKTKLSRRPSSSSRRDAQYSPLHKRRCQSRAITSTFTKGIPAPSQVQVIKGGIACAVRPRQRHNEGATVERQQHQRDVRDPSGRNSRLMKRPSVRRPSESIRTNTRGRSGCGSKCGNGLAAMCSLKRFRPSGLSTVSRISEIGRAAALRHN